MKIQKHKTTEFFITISLILLIMIAFLNLKRLHVKFQNKTGENIDSLVIGGKLIGNLKNGESTKEISFKEFLFDGSIPYEQISGNSNNKKLDKLHWSWCGTNINTKSEGFYYFDIKKALDEKGNPCLYLVQHNTKFFWEE
ncbi:hypothetical protein HNP37_000544 [Flavobacterium nitrogenifigens]|uniref:Uncharacterized protein n=2 Tax=Flavobacterium TaxID=237 RepID=A0A7W7IVA5_9FLAO|nr:MULTISPECIES: hypothetical protein [Flavobacterium]MBB4800505.1 hypothetical protein [Flavobacterium nitrogenifigens]MBB6385745.1 hypothetical protein [Flavobacterium notoginsengisoli]